MSDVVAVSFMHKPQNVTMYGTVKLCLTHKEGHDSQVQAVKRKMFQKGAKSEDTFLLQAYLDRQILHKSLAQSYLWKTFFMKACCSSR